MEDVLLVGVGGVGCLQAMLVVLDKNAGRPSAVCVVLVVVYGGRWVGRCQRGRPPAMHVDEWSCRSCVGASTMCSVVRRDVAYFSRSLMGSARQGAPVDLFVVAAPPWRCPSLFVEDGHLRAAAVGASDEEVNKLLDN